MTQLMAYILMEIEMGQTDEVLQELRKIEEATKISVTTGEYDIVILLEVPTLESLYDITVKQIHVIPGIKETTTAVVEKIDDGYRNNGINNEAAIISEGSFNNVVSSFTVNSLIANIEQMKVLVGNPRFFKSVEDEFKRHSATVGTKKISIVSEYLNEWINNYADRFSTLKQQYKYGQPIITTK